MKVHTAEARRTVITSSNVSGVGGGVDRPWSVAPLKHVEASSSGPPSLVLGAGFTIDDETLSRYNTGMYIPFFNPRLPDLLLGLVIGLSLALTYHWLAWAIR